MDRALSESTEEHFETEGSYINELIGKTLFYGYLSEHTGNNTYRDKCQSSLDRLFYHIENDLMSFTLYKGLAGIGLCHDQLQKIGIIDSAEDVFGDIDDFLKIKCIEEITSRRYDFLHGALGISWYLLKKGGHQEFLSEFSKQLASISIKKGPEIYWQDVFSVNPKEDPTTVNLGLAHGMPGIIIYLAQAIKAGISEALNNELLEGAVNFILSQQLGDRSNIFPSKVCPDSPENNQNKGRLAWCYGDLGIGFALLEATEALRSESLRNTANSILIKSAGRFEIEDTGLVDGGLCHGFAGVSHIYDLLYSRTGLGALQQASDFWFDALIKYIEEFGSISNFQYYFSGTRQFIHSKNYLMGATGVGLVILSKLNPELPKDWNQFLMLS